MKLRAMLVGFRRAMLVGFLVWTVGHVVLIDWGGGPFRAALPVLSIIGGIVGYEMARWRHRRDHEAARDN